MGGSSGRRESKPMPAALVRRIHRQSASIVAKLLKADRTRRGGSAIKALTLQPDIRGKRATHALCCETLRHLAVLKEVEADCGLVRAAKSTKGLKLTPELAYVLLYEMLVSERESEAVGDEETFVLGRKRALQAALARRLAEAGVSSVAALLGNGAASAMGAGEKDFPALPRHVRANALQGMTPATAEATLRKDGFAPERDALLDDVLTLPPGTDLHAHALVKSGELIQQGWSSCLPARALAPQPGWAVVDACAAPGNKTTHLAALMGGEGCIYAYERDKTRFERLKKTVAMAGAKGCVRPTLGDFLSSDPRRDVALRRVKAVLLDPSCSGSGTVRTRGDHLLPSSAAADANTNDESSSARVEALARFQEAALRHALSFPGALRVVYSTCSVYERENEEVVKRVLSLAAERGFALECPFPRWPRRGLPGVEGHDKLVRVHPSEDHAEGFFVALFVRAEGDTEREPARMAEEEEAEEEEMEEKTTAETKKRTRAPGVPTGTAPHKRPKPATPAKSTKKTAPNSRKRKKPLL
mmetsp:Transcript_2592/g.9469  ORF Transcript_2592/g.9469 Transcript_2592/m.9469 type:complete len:530 (+) Transcript_2592:303-1892(+)|eukprot:CAMPEP_0170132874 /NCGR_PEP_ID=MMETSP0033_2-20121228/933_1 /TAXON_ID=195969 /ORGANISM="Dolichomastix tenuilepis, Strain CCMP3274" /LENGTH=529 /DNA_ID=CAMNT_0010368323 /DNA_START=276 /DNA_END=1865 /DNA_ORIENTATION=+